MAAEHDDAYCTEWILNMTMNNTADQPMFRNESDKDDRAVLCGYGRTPVDETLSTMSLSIAKFSTTPSLLFRSVVT